MKLPLCEQAEISMDKLIGYCLNPNHPTGKHKARVFASVLGITTENAQDLLTLIQIAACEGEVIQQSTTPFGEIFKMDWTIPNTANIKLRTIWEISPSNPYPRLISAFIK